MQLNKVASLAANTVRNFAVLTPGELVYVLPPCEHVPRTKWLFGENQQDFKLIAISGTTATIAGGATSKELIHVPIGVLVSASSLATAGVIVTIVKDGIAVNLSGPGWDAIRCASSSAGPEKIQVIRVNDTFAALVDYGVFVDVGYYNLQILV
jgi:hypothetical protein